MAMQGQKKGVALMMEEGVWLQKQAHVVYNKLRQYNREVAKHDHEANAAATCPVTNVLQLAVTSRAASAPCCR